MFRITIFILSVLLLTGCASLSQPDKNVLTTRIQNLEDENIRLARLIENLTLRIDALSLRIDQIVQNENASVPITGGTKQTGNEKDTPGKIEKEKNQKKPNKGQKGQCSATTKKGVRCSRMTSSPNGLCWQHGGN